MSRENVTRSFLVFGISLSAPILVWILLRVVASYNPPSFDPNPWVQSLVQSPMTFTPEGPTNRWVQIQAREGELYFTKNGTQVPLSEFKDASEKLIFVVKAQGPTLAKKYYDFLKQHELQKRSMTLSSSDGFLKDLRFYDNELTLGCGQAYVVRWRALKQLGLHNLMTINMSGVWLDPEIFASSSAELAREFTSLHVPVFVGPLTTEQAKMSPSEANILTLTHASE